MGKIIELFRPRNIAAWVVYVLAGLILMFFLASAASGTYNLQELQRDGVTMTLPVVKIVERDDAGAPTSVIADLSKVNGREQLVENAQGSMIGTDRIHVRMMQDGSLVMALRDYQGAHVWWEVLKVCVLPVFAGLAAVAAINFRDTFLLKEVPSQWATHQPAATD